MIRSNSPIFGLSCLILIFLALGTSFAIETRLFRAPDERMHWFYITELGTGRWPVVTDDPVSHLAHQPPLYYLISQPAYQLVRQQPLDVQVRTIRLFSLLLASLVIVFVWQMTRWLLPETPWAGWLAAGTVALNPQFIFISSVINNDALTNVLGAEIALAIIIIIRQPQLAQRRASWIGWLAAAAFLTKAILWPLVGCLIIFAWWKLRPGRIDVFRMLVPIGLVAAWWLIRNVTLYQDPTALTMISDRWAAEQGRAWLTARGIYQWFNTLTESFWARFGYFNLGLVKPYYQTTKAVMLLAGLGLGAYLVSSWRRLEPSLKQAWLATWAMAAIIFAGVFVYSITFYQPQGRYLFAAMGPIIISLVAGLVHLVPAKRHWLLFVLAVIGLWTLDWASWDVIARRG